MSHEARQRYVRCDIQSESMNHKGKIINALLSKLKTKTFASQKPEFSIYVTHHFLLTYWNLMTDLDFYLTPRTET